jgi:hypothetical protein
MVRQKNQIDCFVRQRRPSRTIARKTGSPRVVRQAPSLEKPTASPRVVRQAPTLEIKTGSLCVVRQKNHAQNRVLRRPFAKRILVGSNFNTKGHVRRTKRIPSARRRCYLLPPTKEGTAASSRSQIRYHWKP